MSNLGLQPEHYTAEDYQHWEGDWELIDGIAYAMSPAPAFKHQSLAMGLALLLAEALDDCPDCQPLFEIDIEFSRDTIVRPDLLVICHTPEGDRITRAPEFIIEIISPRRARHDEHNKFMLYQAEGVAHYLIAYPDERKIKAYRLIDGSYRKQGDFFDETYRVELSKCTLDLDFSRVWKRMAAKA
ncbi:MAG: Uma2 family endonuclease [Halothiobacillaceae bacterium]|nr:MAG: Uma2 family endonuclease [Halothiobacillaceae bacterium]